MSPEEAGPSLAAHEIWHRGVRVHSWLMLSHLRRRPAPQPPAPWAVLPRRWGLTVGVSPAPVGCPVRVRLSTRTTPPFSQLTFRTASRRRQPKRVRKHDGHPRMRRCSKVRSTAGAGGRGARACRRAGTRRHEPTTRRPASRTLHAVLPACGPASTRKHSSTSRRGRSHLCA